MRLLAILHHRCCLVMNFVFLVIFSLVVCQIRLHRQEYLVDLQALFVGVHNFAQERMDMVTEKMKTRFDTKATRHEFQQGGKVWLRNPVRQKGLFPKLQSYWDGQYTVLKRLNGIVVRIRKSSSSKPKVNHVLWR